MSADVDSVQHQARPVTMCDVPVSDVKGAKLCCKRLIGEVSIVGWLALCLIADPYDNSIVDPISRLLTVEPTPV